MRHPNEQSGSSSLFAHPAAIAPVPLEESPLVRLAARDELESRLNDALNTLAVRSAKSTQQIANHLCLFTRWYYRPQARRVGEVIFEEAHEMPKKPLMRAISRVYRQGQAGQQPEDAPFAEQPAG
jgi:hypothetical protein